MRRPFLLATLGLASVAFPVLGGQDEPGFPFVGNTYYQPPNGAFNLSGSCVGVGKNWIIGVTHAGGQRMVLNGETYNVVNQYRHPTADLVLFKVDKALPSYAEILFASPPSLFGKPVKIVACGVGGGTAPGGLAPSAGTTGKRRSGMNRILAQDERMLAIGGNRSVTSRVVTYDLQEGEAGQAAQDSGGGWFVQQDGKWKLAALCAYVTPNTSGARYGYGSTGAGIHLGTYRDWIEKTMRQ